MGSYEQQQAKWEREKQTKALQQQAKAAQEQTQIMKRQEAAAKKERKRQKREENTRNGKSNFHGLYCLVIGWWLAMFIAFMIVPLFFPRGRRFIKKAFGFW